MPIRSILLSVSLGLLAAILVIGLLPFLVILSWSEMLGISEYYTSPLILLNFLNKKKKKEYSNGSEESVVDPNLK